MTPLSLVAGFGCRQGCTAAELGALLEACLAEAGVPAASLAALATREDRALEPGLRALAAERNLPLQGVAPEVLNALEARLNQPSERVRALAGSAGVAEAAALALADRLGQGPAWLVLDKRRSARATCALACIHLEAQRP
ncbi:cobalamin biosynthesis protein [Metapseudomonas furukawaii]|uniref:Cobalamin biosynthesis protein CbiG n=1 Tax=Metapseudomonas furukawaii TaxID=1149133 RepID=A0AAD1BWG4_METFU|nr:cobalamin biosynthesis protein [Pseudomonas furukawaii]ELS24847.1 Cobalamin biosynthesis protein CobE [Pseudomonas furukawaii]BAU72315.1 cobalamin biosynthesis protein CbiG [Pseudomonas furukawaii]